ncbi:MAG: class I SAM-dependent methyltransferase, partial [Candidatus Hodarchaeales archaeon]
MFARKLKRAYETAPVRIQQYLNAEIEYVLTHIHSTDTVLELGCGYGRVLKRIAEKAKTVVGIDISEASLEYATDYLNGMSNIQLHFMTARNIKFPPKTFDIVLGIQNAISAMKIDPTLLITQALGVTKPGGKIILASYSDNIWEERLQWFIQQSQEGLVGDIDFEKTTNGVITCKDGFTATTFSKE